MTAGESSGGDLDTSYKLGLAEQQPPQQSNSDYNSNSDQTAVTSASPAPMMTAQNLDTALQNAFTTVNIFILILIMIAMGAKMKLKHIREHVQKPMGPLAGFISQFVIMPLVAFIVAHMLQMIPEHAIGALIMACSPGGVMSNMVTFYTNGDCSLSITMTTLSTLMAFGMMPANLWLYTRSWTDGSASSDLAIPYSSILLSLLLILIPVAVGYMFVMKYPNMRGVVAQTGSFSGVLAIVISMLLFMFMHWNLMVISSLDIWIATAAMPILGFVLGYILSALFCLSGKQKRTVGFETGCQNASIAFSVIATSFPSDLVGNVLLVPLLFCLFSFIEGWLFVIVWQMAKWTRTKIDEWKEDGWACVDWEESSDESDREEEKDHASWHRPNYFSQLSAALSWTKMKRFADNYHGNHSQGNAPNLNRHNNIHHHPSANHHPDRGLRSSMCFGGYEVSGGSHSLRLTSMGSSRDHGNGTGVTSGNAVGSPRSMFTSTGVAGNSNVSDQHCNLFHYPHTRDSEPLPRHSNSISCAIGERERRNYHERNCHLSSSAGANHISAVSAFTEPSVSRHHSIVGLDTRNIITDV